jgi:hypothetical protein
VVGNLHDDDDDDEGLVMFGSKRKPNAPILKTSAATTPSNDGSSEPTQDEPLREQAKEEDDGQSGYGDDLMGDILELPTLKSSKDTKRFPVSQEATVEVKQKENSNLRHVVSRETASTLVAPFPQSNEAGSLEEEDMFGFDDEESTSQTAATEKAPKYIEEEDELEEEQTTPLADNAAGDPSVTLYSTSPTIPIAKPASLQSGSPASSASKQTGTLGASAGSYKGKPFTIGVVRNEELHRKAAEMGDFNSFVGSVDGRSGVDASDSYSQDPNFFSGTPRSVGERLMQEAQARRRPDSARKQG